MFWYIGGTDLDAYDKAKQAGRVTQDILTNHSPNFAPVIHLISAKSEQRYPAPA